MRGISQYTGSRETGKQAFRLENRAVGTISPEKNVNTITKLLLNPQGQARTL